MATRRVLPAPPSARSRNIGFLVVVALTGFGLAFLDPSATVGATTLSYSCTGVTGDNAGSLGDSRATLAALNALIGGALSLGVDIVTDAPSEVSTTDPFTANFDVSINLPDSLVDAASGPPIGLSSVAITGASVAIAVTGGATANTVSGTIPDQTLSLTSKPVRVSQRISGTITPTGTGPIVYRPGISRLSIGINTTVAGISLRSLTVECSAPGAIGSTSYQPPGFPRVAPAVSTVTVAPGSSTAVDVRSKYSPDAGNPLIESSLRLISPPSAGTATLADGTVTFVAPAAPGTYEVGFEMCADPLTTQGTPGADEVQSFAFAEQYPGPEWNSHPLWFTIAYDGQETAPIVTSYAEFFGQPIPLDEGNGLAMLAHYAGAFAPPTAAALQSALDALPNVEPGDIAVSGGGATTPYEFTFGGRLAAADVAQISIGRWNTWLPDSGLTQILDAAKAVGGAGGQATPPSLETLNAQLFSGAIGVDQWLAGYGDYVTAQIIAGIDVTGLLDRVTKWFPRKPVVATNTGGEIATPDRTVDACTSGSIQFVVTATADVITVSEAQPVESVKGSVTTRRSAGAIPARTRVAFAG